jgi:DNA-binding MarR family transcriptional regulator
MDLDKRFLKLQKIKHRSFGRLVSLQKRFFDEWAIECLGDHGYPNFKVAYFAILKNIGPEGTTNNELADKACVSKQATSKVIRELEDFGLITSVSHEADSRRFIIKLTKKGKELVIKATEMVFERTKEYEKLVGKEEFNQAMDIMIRVMEYEKAKWEEKKNTKRSGYGY